MVRHMAEKTAGPVVRAEHLSLGYRGRAIVRDLSFEIRRGEILGIVGPNGCGKTTLLRATLGLLKPLAGTATLDRTLALSYVPQRDRIDVILPVTASEVVLMGSAARAGPLWRPKPADRELARRALASLGAEHLRNQLFRTLSGGEQQRVLLAKALAAEPDVLVLDEPTAGMDLASEAATIEFLVTLNRTRGVTVVMVTHLLSIVLNSATSVLLMGPDGILTGTVDEVLDEQRLSRLYGAPVHLGRVAGRRTLVVGTADGRRNSRCADV
jgi:ABC-type Mn2+/Zn2+ transport system ATPase subunit